MMMCQNCGGAIDEPNTAYGYAGRWCQCPLPVPNDYPHVSGWPRAKTLQELAAEFEIEQKRKSTIEGPVKQPQGPIIANEPPPETLTPAEFVFWLRGYIAGASHEGFDPKIVNELAKVKT